MTKPRYIELIDESVKATKDFLAKHELLHYMIDPDKAEVDGTRAQKDGIEPRQIYELSTYSTLIEVRDMLHREHKHGDAKPIVVSRDGEGDEEIDNIIEKLLGKPKNEIKVIINLDDVPKEDRAKLKDVLKDIIEKINEEEDK